MERVCWSDGSTSKTEPLGLAEGHISKYLILAEQTATWRDTELQTDNDRVIPCLAMVSLQQNKKGTGRITRYFPANKYLIAKKTFLEKNNGNTETCASIHLRIKSSKLPREKLISFNIVVWFFL